MFRTASPSASPSLPRPAHPLSLGVCLPSNTDENALAAVSASLLASPAALGMRPRVKCSPCSPQTHLRMHLESLGAVARDNQVREGGPLHQRLHHLHLMCRSQ